MFFGASLYCGFNAIQSFGKGFSILKTHLHNIVVDEPVIELGQFFETTTAQVSSISDEQVQYYKAKALADNELHRTLLEMGGNTHGIAFYPDPEDALHPDKNKEVQESHQNLELSESEVLSSKRDSELDIPLYSKNEFLLDSSRQSKLIEFIDIPLYYSDGTTLLTTSKGYMLRKRVPIPSKVYRFTISHVGKEITLSSTIKNIQLSLDGFSDPTVGLSRSLVNLPAEQFSRANYITRLWKNQLGKSGIQPFGIVYLWVNRINRNFMYGRTEQPPALFPSYPLGDLSLRFDQYYAKAMYRKRNDDSIHQDMYDLYIQGGEGQNGINNILNNFDLYLVEETFSSGDVEYDRKYLEEIEDSYIHQALRNPSRAKRCYNKRSGRTGGHRLTKAELLSLPPKYTFENIGPVLINLMKKGYRYIDVASMGITFITKSHTISRLKLSGPYSVSEVSKAIFGRTYELKRIEVLNEQIDSLIDSGFITLGQLASQIDAMTELDIFNYLAIHKPDYLKGLLYSYIYKMVKFSNKHIMARIYEWMGIPLFAFARFRSAYLNFRSAELIERVKVDTDLINSVLDFDRALAKRLLRSCSSPKELLVMLGYELTDLDLDSQDIQDTIYKDLFGGLTVKEAFLIYGFRLLK